MRVLKSCVSAGVVLTLSAVAASAQTTGPNSSQSPYIVPTAPGWSVTSLLTVGDATQTSPYRMVGIPDGLGALGGRFELESGRYVADSAFMTVFMNHELRPDRGAVRAHGQTGAFVSEWTVHLNTLQVKTGADLVDQVHVWNPSLGAYVLAVGAPAQLNRLCAADLPATTAFFNPLTGKGFDGRIFMNGEEAGNEGRGFAHILSGDERGRAYELPALGRFSWENSVAHPNTGDKTIVIGLDDSTPGQVYVYVGDKRADGLAVERAGLTGGALFGIRVTNGGAGYAGGASVLENNGAYNGTFTLVDVSDARSSGAQLQSVSTVRGVTQFARPEDGHWDTRDPRVFYFVTTGATLSGRSQTARLYKLTFDSIQNPTAGTIELVVDAAMLTGTDGQTARSFDNMTVNAVGRVLVQEDPGGSSYIAKVWEIDPVTRAAVQVFESDRERFLAGAAKFLTEDEENSGIIEVTQYVAKARWFDPRYRYYLGVMQAHYAVDAELVEGGQFYIMAGPR